MHELGQVAIPCRQCVAQRLPDLSSVVMLSPRLIVCRRQAVVDRRVRAFNELLERSDWPPMSA